MSQRVRLSLLVAALALLAWLIASVGPWRIASTMARIGWSAPLGLIVLPQPHLYRNPASRRYDGGEEDL